MKSFFKILFILGAISICFSQCISNHATAYSCEEILNMEEEIVTNTTNFQKIKIIRSDSTETIKCVRPFKHIISDSLYVIVANDRYISTISKRLKGTIEHSLKINKCNDDIKIITQKEYLKMVSEKSASGKFFYEYFKNDDTK